MMNHTIGLDIAKDSLEAHHLESGASCRFANTAAGHRALLAWIATTGSQLPKSVEPARVVFEPTGSYHQAIERNLARAGLGLIKVNPRQARHFAEATGKFAKTDRCDAAMLARMGAVLELPTRLPQSELFLELKELLVAREALLKDRTAAKNRAKRLCLPLLRRQNGNRISQIEAVEAAITALIRRDAALARRFDILTSIPGIGQQAAFALLIWMPELGRLDAKQAASLAGLAPVARQSENWTGRAFIRGGRSNVRRALYMPALAAVRFNPDLKLLYQRLKAAGKQPKLAITAAMRKLVVLANALLRDDRTWSRSQA